MKRTNQQNKRLHLYIGLLNIDEDFKKVLCHSFSNGRTIRTSELEVSECERLIAHLKNMVKETDKADKMRKKIISLFRKMGYVANGKADITAVSNWAEKYGYLHKPLNNYTQQELPKLVSQAEAVYSSFIKTL